MTIIDEISGLELWISAEREFPEVQGLVMKELHKPVLLDEVLTALKIDKAGIYIDATFGRGGHSKAILQQLGVKGRLLAMDQDPDAVQSVQHEPGLMNDKRFLLKQGIFTDMLSWCQQQNIVGKVKGILLDLGVSSPQLEDPERGFSFLRDGPLDMRMDPEQPLDAATWINTAKETAIAKVLKQYGEERFAKRIARVVVSARQQQQIMTTKQLASVIANAVPKKEKGKHPATRSFQGIRIFINQELDALQQVLPQCAEILAPGGRLCVISFHSLEDRIVKRFLQSEEKGRELPRGVPVKHYQVKERMRRVGRPIYPSAAEISGNPRARSALLRVGEKQ